MNTPLNQLLALPSLLLLASAEAGSPSHPLTASLFALAASAASPSSLPYRPFLDPLQMKGATWWLLIIPLSFGVSVVYKAVRGKTMQGYWRNVFMMTVQIIGAMVLLGIGLHFVVEWLAPRLSS